MRMRARMKWEAESEWKENGKRKPMKIWMVQNASMGKTHRRKKIKLSAVRLIQQHTTASTSIRKCSKEKQTKWNSILLCNYFPLCLCIVHVLYGNNNSFSTDVRRYKHAKKERERGRKGHAAAHRNLVQIAQLCRFQYGVVRYNLPLLNCHPREHYFSIIICF